MTSFTRWKWQRWNFVPDQQRFANRANPFSPSATSAAGGANRPMNPVHVVSFSAGANCQNIRSDSVSATRVQRRFPSMNFASAMSIRDRNPDEGGFPGSSPPFRTNNENSRVSVQRLTPYFFATAALLSMPTSQETKRSLSWRRRTSMRRFVSERPHTMHRNRSVPVFVLPFRRIRALHRGQIVLCFCMKSYKPTHDFWSIQAKKLHVI